MASKRAKFDGETQETSDNSKCYDFLSKCFTPDSALFQNMTALLESPYDWYFLHAASTKQRYVGKDPSSPLLTCAERFKQELKTWTGSSFMEEASKGRPDGDRVLFAMQIKKFLYGRADCAEKILEALLVLLRTRTVAGWPPAEDNELDLVRFPARRRKEEGDNDDEHNDYNDFRFIDRGVLMIILTTMERYPNEAQVQKNGCLLISKLWCLQWCFKRSCLLVRNALESFVDVPEVQAFGMMAMKRLFEGGNGDDMDFLISVGALNAICDAMMTHLSSLKVQRMALGTARAAIDHSQEHLGCTSLIMKSMLSAASVHLDRPRIQLEAWSTILPYLRNGHVSPFLQSDGISIVCRTLKKYSKAYFGPCPGLRSQALEVLEILCADKEGQKHMNENAVQCVVDGNLFAALGHLSAIPKWATWLSAHGTINHILEGLESLLNADRCSSRHHDHPWLSNGCFALSCLLEQHPSSAFRAIRCVLDMMNFPTSYQAKRQASCARFLASLKWSTANIIKASGLGACEAVHAAMLVHADSEEMQTDGCNALATLFLCESNQVVFAKLRGVSVLMSAIDNFPNSKIVQIECRKLLTCMSRNVDARSQSSELRLVGMLSERVA